MHRFSKTLIGGGVALLVAAAVWHPLVVPQLVKLPDKVDRTDRYSGTFVTFLDQSTGATLATPLEVPLTIDRHVATVPGGTTAHVSLLRETATVHMGDQKIVQESVYAVDRRTMQNVSDPRAWTFSPGNVLDRTGTYYLTLPMGMQPSGEHFQIWKPEAGTSYGLTSTTPATGLSGGAHVVYLQGNIPTPLAVPPYEKATLQARGLPMQLTPQQAAAKLAAAGVDAGALAPVLLKTLSADELKTVLAAMAAPLPLKYFVYGNGLVGAEPKTGGLVSLSGIVDGVSVQPDMTAIAPAVAVLAKHQDVAGDRLGRDDAQGFGGRSAAAGV